MTIKRAREILGNEVTNMTDAEVGVVIEHTFALVDVFFDVMESGLLDNEYLKSLKGTVHNGRCD